MKQRKFALDRDLAEIIRKPEFSSFTITQLRREYECCLAGQLLASSTKVRRYVYKQVGRLVKLGWVTKEGKRMSRGLQYHVGQLPSGVSLHLTEPPLGREAVGPQAVKPTRGAVSPSAAPTEGSLRDIEAKLNRVRVDFIAALGEAETYKSILADHPSLREQLEGSYHQSRDQSSNLMGQLRALEQTVKILEEQQ